MWTRRNFTRLAAALALAASMTACAVISGQENGSEYVDDATVTSKVKAEIVGDPVLRSKTPQVHVETFEGTVQLSGFVDSESVKDRAEDVTRHVRGVKSVKNDIIIRS